MALENEQEYLLLKTNSFERELSVTATFLGLDRDKRQSIGSEPRMFWSHPFLPNYGSYPRKNSGEITWKNFDFLGARW